MKGRKKGKGVRKTYLPGSVPVERDGDRAEPATEDSAESGSEEREFEVVVDSAQISRQAHECRK